MDPAPLLCGWPIDADGGWLAAAGGYREVQAIPLWVEHRGPRTRSGGDSSPCLELTFPPLQHINLAGAAADVKPRTLGVQRDVVRISAGPEGPNWCARLRVVGQDRGRISKRHPEFAAGAADCHRKVPGKLLRGPAQRLAACSPIEDCDFVGIGHIDIE